MNLENILLVGVNHFHAKLACREKVVVPVPEIPETLCFLRHCARLEETVVLSTCSRVEVAAVAEDPQAARERLGAWFIRRMGVEIAGALYAHQGAQALRHLIRVASGLDSWIIGESEIQGQFKQAYQFALDQSFTGPLLNRSFQQAMRAAKSVRSSTGIQNGIHSIGGAAALLAQRIFGAQGSGKALIFGAGQAAEAVARHLAAKNFREILVANRTPEKARALAESLGGQAVSFEEGLRLLSEVEVALFSTAAYRPLLDAAALKSALKGRKHPLFLIDLGVPRNVDPICSQVEGAYLYDLDDLGRMVQESMSAKKESKDKAEAMAAEMAMECAAQLNKPLGISSAGTSMPAQGGPIQ